MVESRIVVIWQSFGLLQNAHRKHLPPLLLSATELLGKEGRVACNAEAAGRPTIRHC